jgi:hypothetical protein
MILTRLSWTWWPIIIVGWIWVTAWVLVHHYSPGSWWLAVHRIEVKDSAVGRSPIMIVERTIRRPFYARWTVTVMRRGDAGFSTYCTAHGQNDYRPSNALPDRTDLDWWTWPTRCALPRGEYIVNALWRIEPQGYPVKEVRVSSNSFTITD